MKTCFLVEITVEKTSISKSLREKFPFTQSIKGPVFFFNYFKKLQYILINTCYKYVGVSWHHK